MKKIPKEIVEFYKSLEKIKSLNIWNIQKELNEIGKLTGKCNQNLVTERKILAHNLNEGKLVPNFQITDIKGKAFKASFFSKNESEYIIKRLSETNNSWLLSRYSHILWNITKHNSYADIAIENYIKSINRIKTNELIEFPIILSAILYLSYKTKRKKAIAKKITFELLNDLPNWFKSIILEKALIHNTFEPDELKDISKKTLNWIDFNETTSYFNNKSSLEVIKKLFNRIQKPTEVIYELLAKNENLILEQHQDDTDFIKITAIGRKLIYLKKARNLTEYNKVSKEYNRLKNKVKLNKLSIELPDKPIQLLNDYINSKSEYILKFSTEKILTFFATDESIVIDPSENILNSTKKENSIYDLFSIVSFDINTNFKQLDDNGIKEKKAIDNYSISNTIRFYLLFYKVFSDGVISGKLNYYKIYNFLENNTWYGTKFKRGITNNVINNESNWLSLLAPGIHNFFSQFELSVLMNTNRINNFVLSIDSLTIKFEGMLRDFIRLSGGSTTKLKNGDIQEQLLDDLLENEIILKYFSDRDIELFKYTFTKSGKNLRNNIAHSFFEFSDYNLQTISLIFFCILRLGKYTFNEK